MIAITIDVKKTKASSTVGQLKKFCLPLEKALLFSTTQTALGFGGMPVLCLAGMWKLMVALLFHQR